MLDRFYYCKTLCVGGLVAMMGHRQKLKGGEEYDAICAKRFYKYIWHHSHNVKKRLARRARRVVKNNLKMFDENA